MTYKEAEPFTTKVKHMDFLNSKAVRDLKRLLRKGKGRKYLRNGMTSYNGGYVLYVNEGIGENYGSL